MAVEGAAEYDSDVRHLRRTVIPLVATATAMEGRYQSSRRGTKISEIVIHDTGSTHPFERTAKYLSNPKDGRKVSIHYLIGRKAGQFVKMVPEDRRANHASSHNRRSIGIELWRHKSHFGGFTAWQYSVLSQLVYDIMRRRRIKSTSILGHGDFHHGKRGEPHGFDWGHFFYRVLVISEQAKAIRREFAVI